MRGHFSNKTLKKWLKQKKAVSPIIATLLMIVISVVAGVMIYGWISGFISTGVPSVPTAYIVTISSVTVSDVDTSSATTHNSTVLKVKISNPGAKDVSVTAANFIVTNSSGYVYDYNGTGGSLHVLVYQVSSSSITATAQNLTTQVGLTGAANTVTLTGGTTTTLYIELLGHESGADTGALDKGDTYILNTQDATTYDGISVTSAEYTFKANK
ncbi:archaellin/type IV pilin N-terminal domain-containing protein [Candidatus Hecatella orcuttiae]|jgi:flagellin-like protein|uniref:archaellin/type IV pilin N-terminal domain-containing protein n=1 Tax=Candidatus Hecatella orcuttiae TaxID=1935119 RepID=UPI0028680D61|nr:archaellin/type IV pilin N-terminal domain-containing protein [Candidatus Hecatella orcuttiae]